jgi:replication factor A2
MLWYRTSHHAFSHSLCCIVGMDFQGGGDSGGGFQSGGGGYGASQGNSNTPQRARRAYDEQTMIPVTVQMALSAHPDPAGGDGTLQLPDGRKIASVQLVGAVRAVNDQSTNVLYQLEDGTGLLDVKEWLNDNDCTVLAEIRKETLQENIYLKVVGQIKDYEGKKMLVASSVRPLSSGNELSHHMLQVVYSAEKFKRADSIVAPAFSSTGGGGVGFGNTSMMQPNTTGGAAGGGDSLKDQVLDFIKRQGDAAEMGASVLECIQMNPSHPESAIRKIVEDLGAEGHLYSTIDEDHYKFAE